MELYCTEWSYILARQTSKQSQKALNYYYLVAMISNKVASFRYIYL